mgnify:FL=1
MTQSPGIDWQTLLVPFDENADRVALARHRQAKLWRGETPAAWPICCSGDLTPEQDRGLPTPNFKEAFYDRELMLGGQVRAALAAVNGGSDAVPSVRVNFGTGNALACVGLEQAIYADKMPWLHERLTKEQIAALEPDDIQPRGSFATGLEFMRYYRSVLGDRLAVFCMDTQGPFDLAHLMYGDELFLALYDDPPFVHHLMELCLEMGKRIHRWMKEINGEPIAAHHHGCAVYGENMGIRICEDTPVLISPDAMDEFAMPYTRRLAQEFGGAWVHYCGRNDHLTAKVCEIPEVRGINFGHIPGKEHDHPFEEDMELIAQSAKVYFGNWPRRAGENDRSYLERLHRFASRGALLPVVNNRDFPSNDALLEYWYSL